MADPIEGTIVESFSDDSTANISDIDTTASPRPTKNGDDVEGGGTYPTKVHSSHLEKQSPKTNGRRRTLLVLGVSGLVILLGLIVGLSVGLTRDKNSSTSNSLDTPVGGQEGDDESSSTPPPTYPFGYTKPTIDRICSSESISEVGGELECREACEPGNIATLCNPWNNQEDPISVETDQSTSSASFFQENVESCVAYAKCQVIDDQSRLPPARADLSQVCSEEALKENPQSCTDACSDVKCCYDFSSEDSCIATQFLTCLDYAPCQNLRKISSDVSGEPFIYTAPPDLDELCLPNLSPDGTIDANIDSRDDCDDICQEASCCLSEVINSSEEDSCLQSNFISCLTYAPCGGLLIPPIHDKVSPPNNAISDVCTIDNIMNSETGYGNCSAICSAADCCGYSGISSDLTTELSDNCFLQDPLGCLEYAPCVVLMLAGGDIDMADDDIGEICDWTVLKNGGEEAITKCEKKCEVGSCCMDLDWQDNCFNEGNLLTCASYAPCSILHLMGNDEVPEPPEELSATCSIFGSTYNATACEELCSQAACCGWDSNSDTSCLLDNIMVCSHWSLYCFSHWTSSP